MNFRAVEEERRHLRFVIVHPSEGLVRVPLEPVWGRPFRTDRSKMHRGWVAVHKRDREIVFNLCDRREVIRRCRSATGLKSVNRRRGWNRQKRLAMLSSRVGGMAKECGVFGVVDRFVAEKARRRSTKLVETMSELKAL